MKEEEKHILCCDRIAACGLRPLCAALRLSDALVGKEFSEGVFPDLWFLSELNRFLQHALEDCVGIPISLRLH